MKKMQHHSGDKLEIQSLEEKLISRGYRQVFDKIDVDLNNFEYIKTMHKGHEGDFNGEIRLSLTWLA